MAADSESQRNSTGDANLHHQSQRLTVETVNELSIFDDEQHIDDDENAALAAYAHSCDAIVAKSVQRYVGFVRRHKRTVDPTRWALICEARGLHVYKERVELRSMASSASVAESERAAGRASEEVAEVPLGPHHEHSAAALRRHAAVVRSPSTMVSAFCVGRVRGSLDAVMAGLYADTTADMRANCTIQFGSALLDCGIVQTFERANDRAVVDQQLQPSYRYFGVKWLEKQSANPPAVVDQLCWVELTPFNQRTGIHTISSGRRFGYQLLKSVVPLSEHVSVSPDDRVTRPTSVSLCYLYCQIDADIVEVFVRGIVEVSSIDATVAMDQDQQQQDAVQAAGDFILAAVRGRECSRMRKLTQLIHQSKSDRPRLTACSCSSVVSGLPKIEMCATCVATMRQRKLVDVRELTRASRSLAADEPSAAHTQLLQTRYGATRHDAEVPPSLASYSEAQSFRMFLPLRDPPPRSRYREARKQRGNVLMHMLQRNHRQGAYLPTFLRPEDDEDDTAGIATAATVAVADAAIGLRRVHWQHDSEVMYLANP